MPDEAFEAYWRMRGGPEIVALNAIFEGLTLPLEQVQHLLSFTQEQLRAVLSAARQLGLVEFDTQSVTFYLLAPDSSQRARLDWDLETHKAELAALVAKIRSQLLIRFLSTPPQS